MVDSGWSRLGYSWSMRNLMWSVWMFNKYPEQKPGRMVLGILGAGFMALGVFLIAIDSEEGVVFAVLGGGLLMLVCFANERTFARVLRVLNWF